MTNHNDPSTTALSLTPPAVPHARPLREEPLAPDDPRHLIVQIGRSSFAMPLSSVLFILGIDRARGRGSDLTLPLAGRVLQVVDLRPPGRPAQASYRPRIVVLGPAACPVAALVDNVDRVVLLPSDRRVPLPGIAEVPAVVALAWEEDEEVYVLDPTILHDGLAAGERLMVAVSGSTPTTHSTATRQDVLVDDVSITGIAPTRLLLFYLSPRGATDGRGMLGLPAQRVEQIVTRDTADVLAVASGTARDSIIWMDRTVPVLDWRDFAMRVEGALPRVLVARGRGNDIVGLPIADIARLVNLPPGLGLVKPRPDDEYPRRALGGVLELADLRAGVLDPDLLPLA